MRPFSPDEAMAAKVETAQPFVIEAVNELLAKKFDGRSCRLYQGEVIKLAEKIGQERGTLPDWATRQTFFDEHWLDFEPIFEKAGWKVSYDKPGYCESYEAFWLFERDGRADRFDRDMVDTR